MSKTIDANKLTKLQKLNSLVPHEIRGQSQVLPRIVSAVQRGELGLTKPGRPRGSFLLLGPTGVGKTETVIVITNQIFGPGQLFRFDMSELPNCRSTKRSVITEGQPIVLEIVVTAMKDAEKQM